jgi:hypothetical protein
MIDDPGAIMGGALRGPAAIPGGGSALLAAPAQAMVARFI